MALDSRDRRASALACGLAFLAILPAPDGLALDQGDRQQTACCYRGIAAGPPVLVVTSTLALEGGFGYTVAVVGGDGFTLSVTGADGFTLDVEGGG